MELGQRRTSGGSDFKTLRIIIDSVFRAPITCNAFNMHHCQYPHRGRVCMVLIAGRLLPLRTLGFRAIQKLAQGHQAGELQSWDLNVALSFLFHWHATDPLVLCDYNPLTILVWTQESLVVCDLNNWSSVITKPALSQAARSQIFTSIWYVAAVWLCDLGLSPLWG